MRVAACMHLARTQGSVAWSGSDATNTKRGCMSARVSCVRARTRTYRYGVSPRGLNTQAPRSLHKHTLETNHLRQLARTSFRKCMHETHDLLGVGWGAAQSITRPPNTTLGVARTWLATAASLKVIKPNPRKSLVSLSYHATIHFQLPCRPQTLPWRRGLSTEAPHYPSKCEICNMQK